MKDIPITEFKQGYAQRSGITLEQLDEFGLDAYPCDCGEKDCQGWQMLHEPPKDHKKQEAVL